jgi:hypothetical protein
MELEEPSPAAAQANLIRTVSSPASGIETSSSLERGSGVMAIVVCALGSTLRLHPVQGVFP